MPKAHVDILKQHNIQIPMDGKGRSIKYEEIYLKHYKSITELRYSIDNYMKKYNSRRLHSAIGNKTPNEVYFQSINNLEFQKQALQKVS